MDIFQKNGVPSAGHKNAFGILPCDVTKINFEKINDDIKKAEDEYMRTQKNTRSVLEIGHLGFFTKSSNSKIIAKYNELSRDNYRIYIKVLGDFSDKDSHRVKSQKISDKYIKYFIDDVCVDCFDPSLDITEALILVGFDNNKFLKCTLRPAFEYDAEFDKKVIVDKLQSLQN